MSCNPNKVFKKDTKCKTLEISMFLFSSLSLALVWLDYLINRNGLWWIHHESQRLAAFKEQQNEDNKLCISCAVSGRGKDKKKHFKQLLVTSQSGKENKWRKICICLISSVYTDAIPFPWGFGTFWNFLILAVLLGFSLPWICFFSIRMMLACGRGMHIE